MMNLESSKRWACQRCSLVGVALLSLLAGAAAADPTLSSTQKKQLRDAVQAVRADEQLVGVQVAVFRGDTIVFSLNAGYADLEHEVPVASDTRFEIASITKAFTGLGLLALAEQGRIDPDAPVKSYLPAFPSKPEGTITARHLAGGLGGVRHYNETERTPLFYATHYADVVEALELFEGDPLVAKPGERLVYSSYGYNLLAATLQGAAGERFQDYIRRTIVEPLGLRNTGHVDVRFPMPGRARKYSLVDPYTRQPTERLTVLPTMDHSYNAGGGNMYSTAEDLALFGSTFIAPGFLSEAVFSQVYAPHLTDAGEPTWFSDGWVLVDLGSDPRNLIAGGSYPGVQAMLRVYPDQQMSIALLTNTWGPSAGDSDFMGRLPKELERVMLAVEHSSSR
jgi:CubicO group peptidase (beta-lactamase class C family)